MHTCDTYCIPVHTCMYPKTSLLSYCDTVHSTSSDPIITIVSNILHSITSNTTIDMSVSDVIPDAEAWMSTEEQSLASMLLSEDQGHVFAAWTPGEHEDKKHALFSQVCTLSMSA